jgi:hypothetical protein
MYTYLIIRLLFKLPQTLLTNNNILIVSSLVLYHFSFLRKKLTAISLITFEFLLNLMSSEMVNKIEQFIA